MSLIFKRVLHVFSGLFSLIFQVVKHNLGKLKFLPKNLNQSILQGFSQILNLTKKKGIRVKSCRHLSPPVISKNKIIDITVTFSTCTVPIRDRRPSCSHFTCNLDVKEMCVRFVNRVKSTYACTVLTTSFYKMYICIDITIDHCLFSTKKLHVY